MPWLLFGQLFEELGLLCTSASGHTGGECVAFLAFKISRPKVLTDERSLLGRRQAFSNGHQEDGHGQQSGDAQRHLLAGLGRNVEHQQGWNNDKGKMVVQLNLTSH